MNKLTEKDVEKLSDIFRKIVDPIEKDMFSRMDLICARMDAIEHYYSTKWFPTKADIEQEIAIHERMIVRLKQKLESL